jgi:hypothetical protein
MAKREAQARAVPLWGETSPAQGAPALSVAGASAGQSSPGDRLAEAERALADRVKEFTDASEALRAEIRAFSAALAEAEGQPPEPGLKLVVSRDTEEVEAAAPRQDEADAPPTPQQIAEFFRSYEEREDEVTRASLASGPSAEAEQRPRNRARERLYADVGGAVIGLCGASALIHFVLLR